MATSIEEVSFRLCCAAGVTLAGSLFSAMYACSASSTMHPFEPHPLDVRERDDALLVSATLSSDDAALLTGLALGFDTGFVATAYWQPCCCRGAASRPAAAAVARERRK